MRVVTVLLISLLATVGEGKVRRIDYTRAWIGSKENGLASV